MSRNLNDGQARDGKAEEPLRFGPEREPQGDTPKGGRPDWKKASARKVQETTAPAEPERRGDGQPPPEQAVPSGGEVQPETPIQAPPEQAAGPPPSERKQKPPPAKPAPAAKKKGPLKKRPALVR